jgi:hypothetical protein
MEHILNPLIDVGGSLDTSSGVEGPYSPKGRLLKMYDALVSPAFDTADVRAFCRLFGASVTAAQSIMFDKVFRRGTRVTEGQFHDELEQRLRNDPTLGGRLTRRDRVAGGFDDLLHDSVIAELKVERNKAITVPDCAKFPRPAGSVRHRLRQPTIHPGGPRPLKKTSPARSHRKLCGMAATGPARPYRSPISVDGRRADHQHQSARTQHVVPIRQRRGHRAGRRRWVSPKLVQPMKHRHLI